MKVMTYILGAILILVGAFSLLNNEINYKTQENVAELKLPEVIHLQVTETKEKAYAIPKVIGGVLLLGGILLVIVATKIKKK